MEVSIYDNNMTNMYANLRVREYFIGNSGMQYDYLYIIIYTATLPMDV